jgi:transposase
MLSAIQRHVQVYREPVDMRKSYDGLMALVRQQEPMSGEVFLFISKDRRRAKALFWDGTGFNIWMKRIEEGVFAEVWKRQTMTRSELQIFFEGAKELTKPLVPADRSHRYKNPKKSP